MGSSISKDSPFYKENEARKAREVKRVKVDYEAFVRSYMEVYNGGGSRIDLCRKLDISYEAVTGRVERLEKKGVHLPPLSLNATLGKQQVDNLQQLVQQLAAPSGPKRDMKKPPIL